MFQANEVIFRTLAEAIPEGVLIVDQKQTIVALNSATTKMFEYDKGELEGQTLELLIPKRYTSNHGAHFKNYKTKPEKKTMGAGRDLFGLKKNGEEFPIEVGLAPLVIDKTTYYIAMLVDITIRKEHEKNRIIQSKALEAATNGVIICDALLPDYPIIYCNEAFKKLSGYTSEEILHKNCRFMQHNDREQDGVAIMSQAIKIGESCQVIVKNYKKDGTAFWNEIFITPVKDKHGALTHFVGIQNDVSERINSQIERMHWERIFDESLNEIYIFDSKTLHFISANTSAQKNIGYSLDELKQITPVDIKPHYNRTEFLKVLAPLMAREKEKIEFETVHERKDGTTYPVEVHLQASKLGSKSVLFAIILDITDQKSYTKKLEATVTERTRQLQEALAVEKELNELKTKFLSLVSHEFKTPISGILTSAILIGKYNETVQQEKREKHLKTIISKVHYLDGILNDFLSVERLDAGKVNYRFNSFQISKVFNEVIYNANMLLKSGQKIIYPKNIDDITIHFDEKILELTLTNLVGNAIKYSPEDTTITIELIYNNGKLLLSVSDEGIGIPKSDQKHIFQRYFRAENVLTYNGTGIGLNIIKGHLDNLNGKISFTNNSPKGSVFIVEIPINTIN